MYLSVKEFRRKELHLALFDHGTFFSITRKEEEERKKGERGVVHGCTWRIWTKASERELPERDSA
jgi:hypothetical protein